MLRWPSTAPPVLLTCASIDMTLILSPCAHLSLLAVLQTARQMPAAFAYIRCSDPQTLLHLPSASTPPTSQLFVTCEYLSLPLAAACYVSNLQLLRRCAQEMTFALACLYCLLPVMT